MRGALLVLLAACGARSELDVPLPHDAEAGLSLEAAAPCTPLTVATNLSGVTQILLDGDYLFFNGAELGRVLKTGGPVQSLNISGGAADIAVDALNIYFSAAGDCYSKRKLARDDYAPVWLGPYGGAIAVDTTAVYVSAPLSRNMTGSAIWKLPFVGDTPTKPIVSVPTESGPGKLTLGSDGLLYGMMTGPTGGILRTDTSGSFVDTLAMMDDPNAMVVDATGVYVGANGNVGCGILRVDLTGVPPPFYYTHTISTLPIALAVDATTVYWTDRGVINASPKTQALVTTVVQEQYVPYRVTPTALAVDDQCLYYATVYGEEQEEEILRIPKP